MSTFNRVLLIFGIGLLLLVVALFCGNMFLSWKAQSRLDSKLAQLKSDGQPVSLADLKPKPVPSEQNAAVHLARMADELKQFDKEQAAFENTKAGKAWAMDEAQGKLPDAGQLQALHTMVDAHPTLLAGLHRTAACKQYASLFDFNTSANLAIMPLKSAEPFRALGHFAQMTADALISEQKYDEAAKLGIELLHVAHLYANEPFLMNHLVSLAVRNEAISIINNVLQRGQVSPEVRSQLETELAAEDNIKQFGDAMRGERAVSIAMAAGMRGGIPSMLGWPLTNMQSNVLDLYSEAIPVMEQEWFESTTEMNKLQQAHAMQSGVSAMLNSQILAGLSFPSIQVAYTAANRNLATVRCLRVLYALTAYAQANGHDAPGIEALNLPKGVATDPFSGQPLKLKRLPDGWVVYSVMTNNVDDGGKFEKALDYGLGPPGYSYDPEEFRNDDAEPAGAEDDAAKADGEAAQPAAEAVKPD